MSKEPIKYSGKISIKPFCDNTVENMGLEKYSYVVFPGTQQVEPLAAIEQNGKTRYVTGLNEFAPDIKKISDPEKQKAVIKEIRETIVLLERDRAFNMGLKVEDKDFWTKVEMFKPDNSEIWSKINIRLSNDEIVLDPVNNLDHLIIIKAVEAGGFSLVASSLEECKRNKKKWYLDRQIDTISTQMSTVKLRNKALAVLETISTENPRKLFYMIKCLEGSSVQFSNRTLPDIIYDGLDKYINGLGVDQDKKRTARLFIETSELANDYLKIKAVVKDACFFKYIIPKGDSMMYEASTNIMLGRNVSDMIEYLLNPSNEEVLDRLMANVDGLWSK